MDTLSEDNPEIVTPEKSLSGIPPTLSDESSTNDNDDSLYNDCDSENTPGIESDQLPNTDNSESKHVTESHNKLPLDTAANPSVLKCSKMDTDDVNKEKESNSNGNNAGLNLTAPVHVSINDNSQHTDVSKLSISTSPTEIDPSHENYRPVTNQTNNSQESAIRDSQETAPKESSSNTYSTVVSALANNNGSVSPPNVLSLDEEINLTQMSDQVNKSALPPVEDTGRTGETSSPLLEDRNLEQFSEILLETDTESEHEDSIGVVEVRKKSLKRVRFADELEGKEEEEGCGGSRSPPPRPTLPPLPTSGDSSKHPGVPISPSPKSPEQKTNFPQHTTDELINGVEYPAEYLGSTPIILSGVGAMKSARMHQAQTAVHLIKDPESEKRPHFSVKVKISTQAVKIADSNSDVSCTSENKVDLMEHPLHSISYVADIDGVLVIMAHIRPCLDPSSPPATEQNESIETAGYIPKMTCHVLDTTDARHVAMVIGQAFGAAYKEFLMSIGVSEESLEEAEYAHILNAQTVPQAEVDSLSDRSKSKKITMAKHKGEAMGIMVMESGYGSAIPACVIAHMNKTGSAAKSGLLNVGDHIISLNGVSLVGMPRKACNEQIKKCRHMNVVKMVICSCPPVVDVTIMRPDLKYQLGFTVQEGMVCSLNRGSIAERSGIRIGHRIIEINGTSTVNMQHGDIVHLLSSTVGDLHIRTMPELMFKLFTGKIVPEYC